MTWQDFDPWSKRSVQGFADQQVAAGLSTPTEASAYARDQFAALLPDGLATPTHRLWTVHGVDDACADPVDQAVGQLADTPSGNPVGHLWMRVRPIADHVEAMVLDVEIAVDHRGRGLGRAAMLAAQDAAEDLGATLLRLTVFGHNAVALAMYEGLGFTVERAVLSGHLRAAAPQAERSSCVTLRPAPEASGRHRRWTAYDGQHPVGHLRLQLQDRAGGNSAGGPRVTVQDLQVLPGRRGRGYERALLAAAEAEARALGATTLSVAVMGEDTALRGVYERAGLRLTAQQMARPLAGRPPAPPRRSLWPSA